MPTTDPALIALVAGLVAAIRKQFPRVDGPYVYLVVLLTALAVTFVALPGVDVRTLLFRAVQVALGAVGGVSLASYTAGKVAALPSAIVESAPHTERTPGRLA